MAFRLKEDKVQAVDVSAGAKLGELVAVQGLGPGTAWCSRRATRSGRRRRHRHAKVTA